MVRYISAGATQLLRRNYQGNYHFNIITKEKSAQLLRRNYHFISILLQKEKISSARQGSLHTSAFLISSSVSQIACASAAPAA